MMGILGFGAALMVIAVMISPCIYGKEFSDELVEIKVQRLLKRLNKPALKSIKSEDGDIIDCIPITNQPALDHPLLRIHTIQMRPSFIPKGDSKFTKKEAKAITQVWHKSGECPDNTVSIRRIKKEDILRAKSVESFGKKTHKNTNEDEDTTYDPSRGHEYAILSSREGEFFGTKFVLNTWRPVVEIPNEFSSAQTWLVSGSGTSRNTIEAGWQVYPGLYGDKKIRLFVYWTSDGYQYTGCYNNDCSGFVQRSKRITVGGSYTHVSQYDGAQYAIPMLIWKDSGNWWLMIGEELVGYWPGDLFDSMGDGATRIEWGGEIVNLGTGKRHTTTDMGSGHFAGEWFKKASYFRKLMTVDGTNTLREPQGLYPYASNVNCYNVKAGDGNFYWGNYFFYGGPGRNAKCL